MQLFVATVAAFILPIAAAAWLLGCNLLSGVSHNKPVVVVLRIRPYHEVLQWYLMSSEEITYLDNMVKQTADNPTRNINNIVDQVFNYLNN